MKIYKLLFLGFLLFLSACEKEQEINPANINGTWAHYHEMNEYFDGMRFHEDGSFQYVERYSYERNFRVKETNGKNLIYTLADKTVSIYNNDSANTPKLIRAFVIKKLTNARLVEESGFQWTGY